MSITDNVGNAYQAYATQVNNALSTLNAIANRATTFSPAGAPALQVPFDYSSIAAGVTNPGTALTTGTDLTSPAAVLNLTASLALPSYTSAVTELNSVTVNFTSLGSFVDLSQFNTPQWSEQYWTNLKNGVANYINTTLSATSLDDTITALTDDTAKLQLAMYSQDAERKQQALRDVYAAADSRTANKGFLFPNSMTTALKLDGQQKFQFDLSQTSRDLQKFIFEWAKTNYQFAIDKGITAHTADTEWNSRYAATLIDAYKTKLASLVEQHKTNLEYAIQKTHAKVEEFQVQVEAFVKQYMSLNDTELKRYMTSIEGQIKIKGFANDTMFKDRQVTSELQQKYATMILETAKAKAGIINEGDRLNIAKHASDVQYQASAVQATVRSYFDSITTQVQAASAAVQAAAGMAASATSSEIAIQQLA